MLLRIPTYARDPGIVLAHFLRPHAHHGIWHAVGSTQRVQIGDGVFDRGRIEIALAGDACVAALVSMRRLFHYDHLRASIVRGDGRRGTCRPETDYHYIRLPVPCRWQPRLLCHVSSLDLVRSLSCMVCMATI